MTPRVKYSLRHFGGRISPAAPFGLILISAPEGLISPAATADRIFPAALKCQISPAAPFGRISPLWTRVGKSSVRAGERRVPLEAGRHGRPRFGREVAGGCPKGTGADRRRRTIGGERGWTDKGTRPGTRFGRQADEEVGDERTRKQTMSGQANDESDN